MSNMNGMGERLSDFLREGEEHLRVYLVNREVHLGEVEFNVYPGDTLEYTRGLLKYFGKRHEMSTLETAMVRKWVTLAPGQDPDPMVEAVVRRKQQAVGLPQTGSIPSNPTDQMYGGVSQQGVAQSARMEYSTGAGSNGAQSIGGVEVLPENWADLPWTQKRAYIVKMTDVELLEDMIDEESPKIQRIIERQIEKVNSGALSPATFDNIQVPLNQMTPPKANRPNNMQVVAEEMGGEEVIQTSFGDIAAPKVGRTPRGTPMHMTGGIHEGSENDLQIVFDG